MPESLDRLNGPATGTVYLPVHLYWGPGEGWFNVEDDAERAIAYQAVLQEGTADEISRICNKERLIADWPNLYLPIVLASRWQESFPQLVGNGAARW